MADRTVEVKLRLVTDQYKREAEEAARASEKLKRGIDDVDDEMKKIPADAAKAAAAMKLLGTETTSTGQYIKGVGKNSDALQLLSTKIKEAEADVRRLGEQFVRTGSVDVWEKLNKSDSQLRALTAMRKKLTAAVGDGVQDGLLDGLVASAKSPSMLQVGAAIGAVLAIPLLAAIGGATAAVAGAGVAGLGVLGAVLGNPEKFKSEWAVALADVKNQFVAATLPFVGPTMDALHSVGPLVQSWHLDKIFADAARFVDPLVHGVGGFVTELMQGIGDLVEKGGPAVAVLQDSLVRLGDAAGSALSSIADGSEGGATALHDLVTIVSLAIEGFGKLLEGAENAYQFMHDHPWMTAPYTGGLSLAIAYTGELDSVSHQLADTSLGLAIKAGTAADSYYTLDKRMAMAEQRMQDQIAAIGQLNKAFDDMIGKTLSLSNANVAVARDFAKVTKEFEAGAHALDVNYAKGQDNISLINETIADLARQRDAAIAAGGGTEDAYNKARAAYNKQIADLEILLGKLLHSKQAAADFMAQFYDKTATITVKVKVVDPGGAIAGGTRTAFAMAQGGIRRAQTGLIIPPSDPGTVLTGEPRTGGEVLTPLRGITQQHALELMQVQGNAHGIDVMPRRWRASGGGGSMPSAVVVQATFVDPVDGTVTRRQIVTAAANRGQSVAQFLGVS